MKDFILSETSSEILSEITEYCGKECSSVMCCPEEECILFRIEKIIADELCGVCDQPVKI